MTKLGYALICTAAMSDAGTSDCISGAGADRSTTKSRDELNIGRVYKSTTSYILLLVNSHLIELPLEQLPSYRSPTFQID